MSSAMEEDDNRIPLYVSIYVLLLSFASPGILTLISMYKNRPSIQIIRKNLERLITAFLISLISLDFCLIAITFSTIVFIENTSVGDSDMGKQLIELANFMTAYFLTIPLTFPFAISIERLLSHLKVSDEIYKKITAWIELTVCLVDLILVNSFYNCSKKNVLSVILQPTQSNLVFYGIIFVLNMAAFSINIYLQKMNKHYSQNTESYYATKFVLSIQNFYFIVFVIFALLVSFISVLEHSDIGSLFDVSKDQIIESFNSTDAQNFVMILILFDVFIGPIVSQCKCHRLEYELRTSEDTPIGMTTLSESNEMGRRDYMSECSIENVPQIFFTHC